MFKETREQMKETDRKIAKLAGLFTTQWGKLIESLITPSCLKLFKDRGIDVSRTYRNVEILKDDLHAEFDVILANGNEVVIVEVKTTLISAHVNEFIEKLAKIKQYLPEHKDKKVYGAVAAIRYENSSDRYAIRKGLFCLENKGEEIIRIANSPTFQPKEF